MWLISELESSIIYLNLFLDRLINKSWVKHDAVVTGFVMMQNKDADTPLHLSCQHGRKDIVCKVISDYSQQMKSLQNM